MGPPQHPQSPALVTATAVGWSSQGGGGRGGYLLARGRGIMPDPSYMNPQRYCDVPVPHGGGRVPVYSTRECKQWEQEEEKEGWRRAGARGGGGRERRDCL
jgi:hypothetical protein